MTTYKNENKKWQPKRTDFSSIGLTATTTDQSITCKPEDNELTRKNAKENNKFLKFWIGDDVWYEGKEDSTSTSTASNENKNTEERLSKVFKRGKFGSWVWIEDSYGKRTLWHSIASLKHGNNITRKYRIQKCQDLFLGSNPELKDQQAVYTSNQFQKISKWQQKGRWLSTEQVCKYWNERTANEDQRKNLKLFCAKPKSEE